MHIYANRVNVNVNDQCQNSKSKGMNSYHICTTCRQRLSRIPLFKPAQWTPRATFLSFNNKQPRTTTDDIHEKPEEKDKEQDTASKDASPFGGNGWGTKHTRTRLHNPYKKRMPTPGEPNPGNDLEALFEQMLSPPKPTEEKSSKAAFSLDSYQKAEALNKMIAENSSVVDTWYHFIGYFGPNAAGQTSSTLPSYLHSPARQLLKQIIAAKARAPFSKTLPSVTEVSFVYLKLGLLHGSDWADMVFVLLENAVKLSQDSLTDPTKETRLLMDLLGAWNIICRKSELPPFSPIPDDPPSLNWSNVPQISTSDVIRAERRHGALGTFTLLAPLFTVRQLTSFPLISAATFILIEKDRTVDKTNILNAAPLVSALRNALGNSRYDVSQSFQAANGPGVEVVLKFVDHEGPMIRDTTLSRTVSRILSAPSAPSAPSKKIGQNQPPAFHVEHDMYKRLDTAFAQRDQSQVDRLWETTMQLPVARDPTGDDSTLDVGDKGKVLSPKLCNHFIMAYMGFRKGNRAVDVWNHMVSNGMSPSARTWGAMLSGCKLSRDRDALESIWKKMLKSEIQPDVHCWTTRISALIDLGRPEAGLAALTDMHRRWLATNTSRKERSKRGINSAMLSAVKPTTETINATISSLLRKQKDEAANRVLAWASKINIRPDTATFNILLRPLIRGGHTQEATKLLGKMQKSGISADEATFTIMIEENFRNRGNISPQEQVEIVNGIFSEMQDAGIGATQHTYSRIIYQLLQTSDGNMSAINAVLQRMTRDGLHASTYIYTMLVEHHFSMQPPDLDAVRSLLEATRARPGNTDGVFWDRLIEGYARAGDTASAMRMLGRLNDVGNNATGFYTLRTLLAALVKNQEWDLARSLVQNTKVDRGGPISHDLHGRDGQHQFWELASELNLVNDG